MCYFLNWLTVGYEKRILNFQDQPNEFIEGLKLSLSFTTTKQRNHDDKTTVLNTKYFSLPLIVLKVFGCALKFGLYLAARKT